VRLVRDAESFGEPLDRAIDAAVDTVIAAGLLVRGSAARVCAALQEKQDLETFVARVGDLLAARGFADLPRLRRAGRVVPHCHALRVGPWRGVFLVDPAGEFAVGLLFSKAPHLLDDRLDELVRRHGPGPEEGG